MTIQKFGPKSLVTAVGLQKFDKSQANSAPTFYAIWVSLSLPSFDPSAERRLAAGNWLMEAAAPRRRLWVAAVVGLGRNLTKI
jgi:hypothetical protein